MEKTYKRVPFDIGLAKDIQSGKIEGRIVTYNKYLVNTLYIIEDKHTILYSFSVKTAADKEGYESCKFIDAVNKFFIELPEETTEQDSFIKKLHDTAEVLATPKHEFKVGDKVKLHILHHDESLIKQYDGKLVEIDNVIDENKIWVKVHHDSIILNFEVFLDEIEFCKELINKSEHEFKPFDKVLVRTTSSRWRPNIYSQRCILGDGTYDSGYMTIDEKRYRYCIPFEGNEHLLGTTKNPEQQ